MLVLWVVLASILSSGPDGPPVDFDDHHWIRLNPHIHDADQALSATRNHTLTQGRVQLQGPLQRAHGLGSLSGIALSQPQIQPDLATFRRQMGSSQKNRHRLQRPVQPDQDRAKIIQNLAAIGLKPGRLLQYLQCCRKIPLLS